MASRGIETPIFAPLSSADQQETGAEVNLDETLNTLRYANRAKNIINKPVVNIDPHTALVAQLRAQLGRLRAVRAVDPRRERDEVGRLVEGHRRPACSRAPRRLAGGAGPLAGRRLQSVDSLT